MRCISARTRYSPIAGPARVRRRDRTCVPARARAPPCPRRCRGIRAAPAGRARARCRRTCTRSSRAWRTEFSTRLRRIICTAAASARIGGSAVVQLHAQLDPLAVRGDDARERPLQPAAAAAPTARRAVRRPRCAPARASCRSAIPGGWSPPAGAAPVPRAGRPRRSPRPAGACWSAACAARGSRPQRTPAWHARGELSRQYSQASSALTASNSSRNTADSPTMRRRVLSHCAATALSVLPVSACSSLIWRAWLMTSTTQPAPSTMTSTIHSDASSAISRARRAGITLRLPCPALTFTSATTPANDAPREIRSGAARLRGAGARPSCPDRRHAGNRPKFAHASARTVLHCATRPARRPPASCPLPGRAIGGARGDRSPAPAPRPSRAAASACVSASHSRNGGSASSGEPSVGAARQSRAIRRNLRPRRRARPAQTRSRCPRPTGAGSG